MGLCLVLVFFVVGFGCVFDVVFDVFDVFFYVGFVV